MMHILQLQNISGAKIYIKKYVHEKKISLLYIIIDSTLIISTYKIQLI